MRGSSFDRDEARRAWRQVARMRGQGGPPRDHEPRPGLTAKRVTIGIVIAVGVVLAVRELTDKDPPPSPKVAVAPEPKQSPEPTAVARATRSPTTPTPAEEPSAPSAPPAVPPPNPTFKSSNPKPTTTTSPPALPPPNPTFKKSTPGTTPPKSKPPTASAAASTLTRPRTETVIQRQPGSRTIPVGTDKATAKIYSKVPLAPRDRAPIGNIAPSGLHVDRIALGTGYAANRCTGPSTRFAMEKVEEINVCLRAVHLRQGEKVMVRWEREGLLMRLTRLYIPAKHAYRTRAGLRLRPGYSGKWTVRVMTADGELELASAPFEVS